ncbi:MAG: T9SS type A sorting domain-containing protein [Flavobacteriales bacterium]|nr:T9SS type A sorting domain-containing protein [Flavobacteriales bacterium]
MYMKKLLLSLSVVASAYWSSAQVIVAGVSPTSIVANYPFTWAEPGAWGTPDFNIPGTFVQDTLMLVDDGSSGTNPQGHPIAQEGCNPLINNLTGKIAVIYRNTCEFGKKAFNAQEAGAVGVIIINRDPDVIPMGGGADGPNVTIPVVMLGNAEGALLVEAMQTESVVVFMGNKTGLFANDIGLSRNAALIPKLGAIPSILAQSGSEFNFDLGARVYNPGSSAQTNVSINAKIVGPSSNVVYDNTVSGLNIAANDSVDVDPTQAVNLPQFSLATYPAGRYTLTYTVSLDGLTDEYDGDNSISTTFTINENIYGYAQLDATTNLPNPTLFYRPSDNNNTFSICTVIDNPNASRVGAAGVYFAASNTTASLAGEEIALYLYKWEDAFTDLNDAAFGFNSLTEIASGFYYFPTDLQSETVYAQYNTAVALENNQRYLACAQTSNVEVFLGHEGSTNYTWNFDYYAQPMSPGESDGTYFATGFGADIPNALAVKLIDVATIGLGENSSVEGNAYPNPATDAVTISIDGEGVANLTVTDIAGKVVISNLVTLNAGNANVNIASLNAGIYVFNVALENGKTSQFKVTKR